MAEYLRCYHCGKPRWVTHEYMAEHGMGCHACGGQYMRQIKKLTLQDKLRLAKWYLWHHAQDEPGWKWSRHPIWFVRILFHWFFGRTEGADAQTQA